MSGDRVDVALQRLEEQSLYGGINEFGDAVAGLLALLRSGDCEYDPDDAGERLVTASVAFHSRLVWTH